MNDILFIFWWSKNEIQWVNNNKITKTYDDQKVRFNEEIKKQVKTIVNEWEDGAGLALFR